MDPTAASVGQAILGFQNRKENALGKLDKSSAGRIDPRAVDICSAINERSEYYTLSSCAGRCFIYRGDGIKSHHHFAPTEYEVNDGKGGEDRGVQSSQGLGFFERYRVTHDCVRDPRRYFDVSTLDPNDHARFDPTGGGDQLHLQSKLQTDASVVKEGALWLRFEPFILHVMCRSLDAASALMGAARPSFKSVGLTSWKASSGRYIVAVWGDEGIDMPLTAPDDSSVAFFCGREEWLSQLVKERYHRNWAKIDRFVTEVRNMPKDVDHVDGWWQNPSHVQQTQLEGAEKSVSVLRHFDIVGDVAILNQMPPGDANEREAVGKAIMSRNKAIKICAARAASLSGTERAPGSALAIIAGAQRHPLTTSHMEYGIRAVVDLNNTFFSPRMGPERLRICQQVARGENVLVLFSGVAMDAMQIAGRTEAASVLAVELNPAAAECARRGKRMLDKNKAVKAPGAAQRLEIIEGDVMEVLPTLDIESYDRILAPRPKEGALDGDLGVGDGGVAFLEKMLAVLKPAGGECHWYDFAADHELPTCERTQQTIQACCDKLGLKMEVIHVAKVGSIAKRQFRICMDFRLIGKQKIKGL